MNRTVDSNSLDAAFSDLLDEGISNILSEPVEVVCPDCGKAFEATPLVTDRCPSCGSPVNWE